MSEKSFANTGALFFRGTEAGWSGPWNMDSESQTHELQLRKDPEAGYWVLSLHALTQSGKAAKRPLSSNRISVRKAAKGPRATCSLAYADGQLDLVLWHNPSADGKVEHYGVRIDEMPMPVPTDADRL